LSSLHTAVGAGYFIILMHHGGRVENLLYGICMTQHSMMSQNGFRAGGRSRPLAKLFLAYVHFQNNWVVSLV
jgi:hypothetical protein